MHELVSVIIPTYNAGEYLSQSLNSILWQSYENIEVLIVDDGSTDGSLKFIDGIKDLRIRVIRQENGGKPVAMNRALDEMKGRYYAIQDADDLSHPQRIEKQLAEFRRYDDLAAVYCGHELIIGHQHCAPRFRLKDSEACRADIAGFRMPAHDPTGMYRTEKVSGLRYDPKLLVGEGLDYILRVGENYPMRVLEECLYGYRIHSESLTKRDPARRELLIRDVYRRACERRGLNYDAIFPKHSYGRMSRRILDNGIATDFMESVVDLRRAGRIQEAVITGIRCAALCPRDLHYYKALLYAVMPSSLRRKIRPSERKA